ncbi:glycoside hydrolase family 5 protein [Streptomyces sp. TRM76323]|uniref:cellulase n=1 Tax=Streptomyces tamarix TaxID=3078565 RepID=A0ABU3QQR6_9ACTN|nr:glycoside hydrolase family 5 protein [Streptomyces tamarix]MDT9685125.1 glycoside hydrolase family 5 protein [Streptomyces tamarix]
MRSARTWTGGLGTAAGALATALFLGLTTAPAAPAAPAPAARTAPPVAPAPATAYGAERAPAPGATVASGRTGSTGTGSAGHGATAAATAPAAATTPAAVNGRLKVCGTKLCNQYGKPVQLRGMSTHGLQWYGRCVTPGSLDALAGDWRADVLRVSLYVQEGGYETDPRRYTDLVHSVIEQATARGMYAIVDWHMLSPGDPYHNLSRAKTFFTEIAQRHRGKTNLLYEIANEPSGVSWSRIKGYAEELIPVIRAHDPNTPVLVGTRAWSSLGVSEGADESEVVANPVNAANIMYTFHFYASSHRDAYLATLSRAADRLPVFVTEFGTQNYAGEGDDDFAMAQRYLDLMAAKKISWVNWNFSDDHRTGAVFKTGTCANNGPWAGTAPLKPAGVWVRDRIRTPDDFPTG